VWAVPKNLWDLPQGNISRAEKILPGQDFSSLVIPDAFGSIQEKFISADAVNKDKCVLLIQDSHANIEAQTAIRSILDFLHQPNSSAKPDVVALEGAKGPVDVSLMRRVPDAKAKTAVAQRFLEAAYFTGAEVYAILCKAEPPALFGVEEKALYYENLNVFRKVCGQQQNAKALFDKMRGRLDGLKERILAGEALE